uniref:Uncharacterized protein n=1 Tax=Manihot esculenta TaxID=3983 RepID=A0A2C9U1D6_MANES
MASQRVIERKKEYIFLLDILIYLQGFYGAPQLLSIPEKIEKRIDGN